MKFHRELTHPTGVLILCWITLQNGELSCSLGSLLDCVRGLWRLISVVQLSCSCNVAESSTDMFFEVTPMSSDQAWHHIIEIRKSRNNFKKQAGLSSVLVRVCRLGSEEYFFCCLYLNPQERFIVSLEFYGGRKNRHAGCTNKSWRNFCVNFFLWDRFADLVQQPAPFKLVRLSFHSYSTTQSPLICGGLLVHVPETLTSSCRLDSAWVVCCTVKLQEASLEFFCAVVRGIWSYSDHAWWRLTTCTVGRPQMNNSSVFTLAEPRLRLLPYLRQVNPC